MDSSSEKISEFTVRRLSNYFRILTDLDKRGTTTVSSARLAELGGITSAQVRKDLSYFGNFGTRGLNHRWTMALFGAGFLGHALFFHQGFREDGFYFEHVFDTDASKHWTRWGDREIRPLSGAEAAIKASPVEIAVIATPPEAAQDIVDLSVRVGVKGILNFAPTQVLVPDGVYLRNVNLAVALESLSFFLSQ
jgi:redox-sensing transcriptional repressor